MKKVFTTTIALIITSGTLLLAQLPNNKPTELPKQIVKGEKTSFDLKSQNTKRAAAGPEWFSTADALGATSVTFMTLFPDTNALFEYSATGGGLTYSRNIINSAGLVFDPRSGIFKNTPFQTTKFSSYTIDSLAFYYIYRRFNTDTNLVDTLVVTTFNRGSMTRYFPTLYAGAVDYTTNNLTASGTGAIVTKILLTKDDTSTNLITRILAVNRTVAGASSGANWFGTSITFLPGYRGYRKVAPFDTVTNFVSRTIGANKANGFRLYVYFDNAMFVESDVIPAAFGDRVFNHGIVAEQDQRYRRTTTQLQDYYYPAFYQTAHMFPIIEYKVSSPNVSINSVNSANISDIYPNPSNNQDVVVKVNSSINTSSEVIITDMSGKVISTLDFDLQNGVNEINLSTAGSDRKSVV